MVRKKCRSWIGFLAMAFVVVVPGTSALALPKEEVKSLEAQRKKASKVSEYVRLSFKLGELYRTHKAYSKAISLYKALMKKYNKPRVLCGVYHFWAQSLLAQKKYAAGLVVYRRLLKKFRGCQCEYVPNAYVAMGRAAFEKKDYADALKLYQKAPRCRENRIAAVAAEYMKGWCTYKLGKYRRALRSMSRTLRQIRKIVRRYKGKQKAELLRVQKEALPNFVRAFSRAGNVRQALRTFRRLAERSQADAMLEQLAGSYRTTKKYGKLIVLYQRLARANRRSPRRVYYWLEVLRASHRVQNKRQLLRSLRQLEKVAQFYLSRGSENAKLKKDLAATQKQIHQFAKYKHTEAQKNSDTDLYRQAEKFFASYRRLFPKAGDIHTMSFWHGEVLLELKKYKKAAQAYDFSARHSKASKYKLDATYKAALAHHRLLRNAQSLRYQKPSARKRARAKVIPKKYQDFLRAGAFYRSRYPSDKNVPYVAYNMGLVFQKYQHWKKARKELAFVVERHTQTRYALPSAYHIVDTLRIRQEWKLLHEWTKKFAQMKGLGRRVFKRQMLTMSHAARLKSCFVMDIQKQYTKAAVCYLAMAKDLGNHKDTPTVLYNAHVAYHNARKMKKAESIKKEILKRFPRSKPARMLKR